MSFYATSWDLRSLIVSRSLKDIVRARVRRSLHLQRRGRLAGVVPARVEKMAATPFHGTGMVRPGSLRDNYVAIRRRWWTARWSSLAPMIDQQFVYSDSTRSTPHGESCRRCSAAAVYSLASVGGRIFALRASRVQDLTGYRWSYWTCAVARRRGIPLGQILRHYGWCVGTGSGNYVRW